jgi:hypothetical protein
MMGTLAVEPYSSETHLPLLLSVEESTVAFIVETTDFSRQTTEFLSLWRGWDGI